jgi:hypothetical protein
MWKLRQGIHNRRLYKTDYYSNGKLGEIKNDILQVLEIYRWKTKVGCRR